MPGSDRLSWRHKILDFDLAVHSLTDDQVDGKMRPNVTILDFDIYGVVVHHFAPFRARASVAAEHWRGRGSIIARYRSMIGLPSAMKSSFVWRVKYEFQSCC
jgi:hypothetical protein